MITGLKTFVVNAGSLNWVFCKIWTNEGLTGLGEGSVTSKEATVAQAIMEHVSRSAMARRPDPQLRHQRRRDRALGHPRPGARGSDL